MRKKYLASSISFNKLDRIIGIYGLRPATQRPLSLFTLSCVAYGYTKLLRERIGISYRAVGGLGDARWWHSMLNERAIAKATRAFIRRHPETWEKKLLAPARKRYRALTRKLRENDRFINNNSIKFFRRLATLLPEYMACIGVYNCFWRMIGDGSNSPFTEKEIYRISIERSVIAKEYPRIEKHLMRAVRAWGRQNAMDGDCLRYCTRQEMIRCGYRFQDLLQKKEIAKRKKGFFYLYTEHDDREYVVTDTTALRAITRKYYNAKSIKILKGQSVFSGIARGTVMQARSNRKHRKIPADMIFVASMTHPSDITMVRKAKAIVTDEGGILCHAAIVSRELSIPCVIGTKIATRVFKDGDRVEVDAKAGIVRKIST